MTSDKEVRMHRFFEFFGRNKPEDWNRKVFTPVIHLPGYDEAFDSAQREVGIAIDSGADGAILISHGKLDTDQLSAVWKAVTTDLTRKDICFPIGINWLNLSVIPEEMIVEAANVGVELVWSDATDRELEIDMARGVSKWKGLYCGAFAFKYQLPVSNEELPAVLQRAFRFMDVPITSGDGTGVAIDLEKARICREVAGTRPIGLASGVSMENIHNLLPYFDWFLVSSALALKGDWYRHDPARVRELANTIHNWRSMNL